VDDPEPTERRRRVISQRHFWHNFLPMRTRICALLLTALFSTVAQGQAGPATVSFSFDFPHANPSHYEITVTEDGKGSYSSNGQLNQNSAPADPAPLSFTLSEKVRAQILDLAARAHYFKGKIDSGNQKIANTGAKTITYRSADQNSQATYNYSTVAPVQEITAIFENLSTTLEFGRRLNYFRKYQKLALDDDLKRMEELQGEGNLGDVQAIAPILNGIADDTSVMNVSRSRALRLLAAK
jgi:hypothetical protein